VERTHVWGNQDGKLRWCTERRRLVVAFWLALARRRHRAWSIGASRLGLLPLGRPPTPPGAAPQRSCGGRWQAGEVVVDAHGS
jgi:hypothetical protein